MVLKPQDVLVLLKLTLLPPGEWTYPLLSRSLFLSLSEVHEGVKRAQAAKLLDATEKRPARRSLLEFLVYGVRYAYPPTRGGLTRGMPTGYAAPPLVSILVAPAKDVPPVWPDPEGQARGYEFSPLYKSVPRAAAADPAMYELLALVDAIRDGRAREVALATDELKQRLVT